MPDHKQSRREFVRSFAAAALGAGLGSSLVGFNGAPAASSSQIRPLAFADLHVHPLLNQWIRSSVLGRRLPIAAKLAAKMLNKTHADLEMCHNAGVDLMCVAHINLFDEWASMPTDPNPHAPANTLRMIDMLEREACGDAGPFVRVVKNPAMLREALSIPKGSPDYRVAAIHALEGGHALGGSLEPLAEFARRGVSMISITHFFNKGIATSGNSYAFFPDAFSDWPNQGLSEFGSDVIREMERLGIIVDLAHATSTAIRDALRVCTRPPLASHIAARTLGEHPYALVDEHIEEIVHRGGLIGVIIMPYWLSNFTNESLAKEHGGLRDVVRTVEHIAKLTGGFDHIGIGSDFGGYITAPNDISRIDEIGLLKALLVREFSTEAADKVMAGNVTRFLLENWRSGSTGEAACS